MKTNFRRSVSALVILTPAALLAACSSTDGVRTARSDNGTQMDSNGRVRSDGRYSGTDRGYASADGRTVYNSNRYYTNDPYGDGVGGGPGTGVVTTGDGRAVAYDTRTNDMNNPNWRAGPTRFDNDNPSQDNSSSQYNSGVTRNQSPADGTVNNQNIAKGTVRPEGQQTDTRWQSQNQQNWQNQQNDPNWQARNQQPWDSNRDRNQNQSWYQNNQNQSWYQNNQSQSNQQVPTRDQNGNWIERNLNTTNMTTPDQQAAARQMSDPATNPTNSNSQYNTQSNNPDYASRTYPAQNNNSGGNYSNQNPSNQNSQTTQTTASTSPAPSNGVTALGPQNNWGANRTSSTAPSTVVRNEPAYRNSGNVMSPSDSQQAAARDISDPATNPSNSNAQTGQPNNGGSNEPATARSNQPYSSRPADLTAAGQPVLNTSNATADTQILSLIHMSNQEEIAIGRLAATNGSSAAIKDFGGMMVRDHTAADAKVLAVASQTGTTLLSVTETRNLMRAEKAALNGDASGKDRAKMADDSKSAKEPIDELRGLKGADFDKAFAQMMSECHGKLAAAIEKAKPQVRNEQTRQLLAALLPTVQMHEKMARELPGFSETASTR